MTRSLSLLVPALMGHDANLMLDAVGMGDRNFRALCYDAGGLMVGLHDWQIASAYTDIAVPEGGWEAHGLTAARVGEILAAMVASDLPYAGLEASYDEFADLASGEGVTWGARLPLLPAPGSMATVTAGEFYRTDQEHIPVVRVVQTHVRDNPAHDDLSALLALFEPQRDPFTLAPWLQPVGSVGLYQLTNLIGGPELVTHAGQVWRCIAANNSYAPGVWGWEIQA